MRSIECGKASVAKSLARESVGIPLGRVAHVRASQNCVRRARAAGLRQSALALTGFQIRLDKKVGARDPSHQTIFARRSSSSSPAKKVRLGFLWIIREKSCASRVVSSRSRGNARRERQRQAAQRERKREGAAYHTQAGSFSRVTVARVTARVMWCEFTLWSTLIAFRFSYVAISRGPGRPNLPQ